MKIKSLAVTRGVSFAQLLVNDKLKLMGLRLICHELQSNESSFCLFHTCQTHAPLLCCMVPRLRNGTASLTPQKAEGCVCTRLTGLWSIFIFFVFLLHQSERQCNPISVFCYAFQINLNSSHYSQMRLSTKEGLVRVVFKFSISLKMTVFFLQLC